MNWHLEQVKIPLDSGSKILFSYEDISSSLDSYINLISCRICDKNNIRIVCHLSRYSSAHGLTFICLNSNKNITIINVHNFQLLWIWYLGPQLINIMLTNISCFNKPVQHIAFARLSNIKMLTGRQFCAIFYPCTFLYTRTKPYKFI